MLTHKILLATSVVAIFMVPGTVQATTPELEYNEIAPEIEDVCHPDNKGFGIEKYSADCRYWRPLLGTWTNPKFGGQIEFRLQSDRTVTAVITGESKRMRDQGYYRGMTVLSGWKFGGVNKGTWAFNAKNGWTLRAKLPGREPDQALGRDKWLRVGTLHIDKKRPTVLNLSAVLEGRLSNYTDWVR